MKNKQCPKCELYNSLGCPYSGSDWEEGDVCDEFRKVVVPKLDRANLRQLRMTCLSKGDCGRCIWDGECKYQ